MVVHGDTGRQGIYGPKRIYPAAIQPLGQCQWLSSIRLVFEVHIAHIPTLHIQMKPTLVQLVVSTVKTRNLGDRGFRHYQNMHG